MNRLTYIRHGEHEEGTLFSGLSTIGCDEVRSLRIDRTEDRIGIAPDKPRLLGSVALALCAETENHRLEDAVVRLLAANKIRVNNDLDYKDPATNEQFMRRMFESYEAGKNLRFFIDESDEYEGDISTYSRMAGAIAESIVSGDVENQVICAREFFVPSFRSRISQLVGGNRLLNDYIEWYESTQELNPEARREVAAVTRCGEDCYLQDSFGEVGFKKELLDHLILHSSQK